MSKPDDPELHPAPMAPKKARRRIVLAVAVVVILWAFAAGYFVVSGARSANSAADSIDAFSKKNGGDLMSLSHLVSGDTDLGHLRTAERSLKAARQRLNSPIVAPLKLLPVIGRQVRSAQALTNSSFTVTGAAIDAFDQVRQLVDAQDSIEATGEERTKSRLNAASDLETVLKGLKGRIDGLDLGPTDGLFGTLANARSRFSDKYVEATTTLDDAIAGVSGTKAFLSGPEN
ncbi:MAG TPA: hypothetical protein VL068_07820, partial [Microthrixaceae bacterium]|nr:hypothetical protein [Microthrixaceae bacterium]